MANNQKKNFNNNVKQMHPTSSNDQLGENRAPEYEDKNMTTKQNTKKGK